jgi:hypothetical protein
MRFDTHAVQNVREVTWIPDLSVPAPLSAEPLGLGEVQKGRARIFTTENTGWAAQLRLLYPRRCASTNLVAIPSWSLMNLS